MTSCVNFVKLVYRVLTKNATIFVLRLQQRIVYDCSIPDVHENYRDIVTQKTPRRRFCKVLRDALYCIPLRLRLPVTALPPFWLLEPFWLPEPFWVSLPLWALLPP